MDIRYYRNLDGVRAIAALLVLVFHFFQSLDFGPDFAPFIDNMAIMGSFGVSLFFVLSGFLITRILLHTPRGDGYFRRFYIRRALRIFPLYYLFLLLWYFVYPQITGVAITPFSEQLYYYTYQQGIPLTFKWKVQGPGHFWTLGVEEYFYFFWPPAVYFLSRKGLSRLSVFIVVLALLTKWWLIGNGYNEAFFPFARFDALAMGALLALLEPSGFFRNSRARYFLAGTVFFMVVILLCNTSFVFNMKAHFEVFKLTFIAVVALGCIGYLLCLKDEARLNRLLCTPFFSFSGKISYGLYVYNPMIFGIVSLYVTSAHWLIAAVIGIGGVFLVSSASYFYFERPFLQLKKRFE